MGNKHVRRTNALSGRASHGLSEGKGIEECECTQCEFIKDGMHEIMGGMFTMLTPTRIRDLCGLGGPAWHEWNNRKELFYKKSCKVNIYGIFDEKIVQLFFKSNKMYSHKSRNILQQD